MPTPSATNALAVPLSPANDVNLAMRALHSIMASVSGREGLAAQMLGDPTSRVKAEQFAPAWEGARGFRDHFLLTFARTTRDDWRRDCAQIVHTADAAMHPERLAAALDSRLQLALDFAFRFLTPRHLMFLTECLTAAFEVSLTPTEFRKELIRSAGKLPRLTPEFFQVLSTGRTQPPAEPMATALAYISEVQSTLSGQRGAAALKSDTLLASVDEAEWEAHWSNARNYRNQFVLGLAIQVRNEWVQDCANIDVAEMPQFIRGSAKAKALTTRLAIAVEFAFKKLSRRHVCLLADAIVLALEPFFPLQKSSSELAAVTRDARGGNDLLHDAVVVGASGMHRYDPMRVIRPDPSETK